MSFLITGSAKKLGREIALNLSKDYPLILHYFRSQKEVFFLKEEIEKMGGKAEIIYGDFSSIEGTYDFLARYHTKTKGIIYSASLYHFGSFLTTPQEKALSLWNGNFFACYLLIKALIPSLIAQKGSILTLGVAGLSSPFADLRTSWYTLCKSNLWMMTKALAKELAPHQVRCNMVSPGYLQESVDMPSDFDQIPMKRPASYQEVVEAIRFLLDEKNRYITGQNIEVAGGVRL